MSRFEPSGDPVDALKHGLYVDQPGQSVANRTLALLELRPKSSHLLAGPSGTGKTMQLRVLEHKLSQADDLAPIFVDVTTEKRNLQTPGALIEHLSTHLKATNKTGKPDAAGALIALAILAAITAFSSSDTVQPPTARSHRGTRSTKALPATAAIPAAVSMPDIAQYKRKPVLLLDSLDRLPIEVFRGLCTGDLARIQEHMAVVVVGPPAVMYGAARDLVDRFNYLLRQPTYDPKKGGEIHNFLTQILRQRAEEDLLPATSCIALVEASGGIVRDLIALTQLSIEESYVAGNNCVETADVRRAIDTFGRKHIIGLDSRELEILDRVRKTGTFVRIDDQDVSLLVTRRVLEYMDPSGAPTFAVHPTLLPLLEQMGRT